MTAMESMGSADPGPIALNDWAARDLCETGDTLSMDTSSGRGPDNSLHARRSFGSIASSDQHR